MAPPPSSSSTSSTSLPPESPLQTLLLKQPLTNDSTDPTSSSHPPHLHHLATQILFNLQHEHAWSALQIHTSTSTTLPSPIPQPLPRPILSGLPPKRLYIHPDEQIELIKASHSASNSNGKNGDGDGKTENGKIEKIEIGVEPELEWVLPVHVQEKWTLERFAEVFDALGVVPPSQGKGKGLEEEKDESVGKEWRGENRKKRLLLAILSDDSTVVYYVMHDGVVKPRQN